MVIVREGADDVVFPVDRATPARVIHAPGLPRVTTSQFLVCAGKADRALSQYDLAVRRGDITPPTHPDLPETSFRQFWCAEGA